MTDIVVVLLPFLIDVWESSVGNISSVSNINLSVLLAILMLFTIT